MTKITKYLIRFWLTGASLAGFALGWILIAHAPKPEPLAAPAVEWFTAPAERELPPIPSLASLTQGKTENASILPQTFFSRGLPRLRTHGS